MANEKDDDQFGKEEKEFGQTKQPPTGQQGQQPLDQHGRDNRGATRVPWRQA